VEGYPVSNSAILLSGGMDSFALTYEMQPDLAITIDYGQLAARAEIEAAEILTNTLGIRHWVLRADLPSLGSGDLSATPPVHVAPVSEWWPYRNQALITIAAMKAIAEDRCTLNVAVVRSDAAHSDGTQDFVNKMDSLMRMQEGGIRVRAPAINRTTRQLIGQSGIPLSLLAWSHSCHTGSLACSRCRGCAKNRAVWEELEREPAQGTDTQ
jgi:7-cyano-7-deazaguanine synthase